MTIEIAMLISFLSVSFNVYQIIQNLKRNKASDDKQEASQLSTVIVKLENIGNDTAEIKADMKDLKTDVKHNTEQIIRLDERLKSAEKAINQLQGKEEE